MATVNELSGLLENIPGDCDLYLFPGGEVEDDDGSEAEVAPALYYQLGDELFHIIDLPELEYIEED